MTNVIQQYATEIWQEYDLKNGPEMKQIQATYADLMAEIEHPAYVGSAGAILTGSHVNAATSTLVYLGTLNIAHAIQGLVEVTCKKLNLKDCTINLDGFCSVLGVAITFMVEGEYNNINLEFAISPQSKEQLLSWYMDPLAALLGKEFKFLMVYTTIGYRSQPEEFVDFKDFYKAIKRRLTN